MATARTTYQDGRGAEGAATAGHTFVWVSLHDPSPEELASVQHEFALPGPLIDDSDTSGSRPALEVSDQLVFAAVNTISWVAAEEAVRLERIQLVLGDGFVVSVDRNERAVERVSQDLRADAELAGAGPAAVLTCVLDHATERYGPVLSVLNDAVDEAAQAVFNADRSRPTERLYHLARQVLEFRRAAAPLAEMLDRLATELPAPAGDRFRRHFRLQRPHLQHWSREPTRSATCSPTRSRLTWPRCRSGRTPICAGSRPGPLSGPYQPCSPASTEMNFRHMPELSWRFGYPLVLVAMVAICLGLYRAFRHYGWL